MAQNTVTTWLGHDVKHPARVAERIVTAALEAVEEGASMHARRIIRKDIGTMFIMEEHTHMRLNLTICIYWHTPRSTS